MANQKAQQAAAQQAAAQQAAAQQAAAQRAAAQRAAARMAKQAAEELGIDTSYWYRGRRDGKLEIWTPYIRRVWTPPDRRKGRTTVVQGERL